MRRAQGAGPPPLLTELWRAGSENGHNGLDSAWHTVSYALRNFKSTFPLAGGAHCAEHRVGANPTMNTMNTGNTIDGQWYTVSHVLRKFHGTWLTRFPVLTPVFLVFPVFPVGLARSTGSAQCAPPANRPRSHVLRKFHGTWLTRFLVLTPVFLVFPVFPVGLARSIGRAHGAKHRVRAEKL